MIQILNTHPAEVLCQRCRAFALPVDEANFFWNSYKYSLFMQLGDEISSSIITKICVQSLNMTIVIVLMSHDEPPPPLSRETNKNIQEMGSRPALCVLICHALSFRLSTLTQQSPNHRRMSVTNPSREWLGRRRSFRRGCQGWAIQVSNNAHHLQLAFEKFLPLEQSCRRC